MPVENRPRRLGKPAMERCWGIAGLAAALALLAARPAPAYVLERQERGGRFYPIRWSVLTHHVWYVLNDQPLSLLPNLASDSDPMAAVAAALQTWGFAPPGLALQGSTPVTSWGQDGKNLITFANTPANRDITSNAVAATLLWGQFQGSDYLLTESDTVFSPLVQLATDGSADAFDIQGALTHELGHVLGIDHSPLPNAVMYPFARWRLTMLRRLSPDDIAAAQQIYPAIADPGLGSISGRVLDANDSPVFGAEVSAWDAAGIARVSALSDKDGSFLLTSLPPGDYQVCAQPLVSRATPEYFDPYYQAARTDFSPRFAGGDLTARPVSVEARKITPLTRIWVGPPAQSLRSLAVGLSPDGQSFDGTERDWVAFAPGSHTFLVVICDHLDLVPDDQIQITGPDLTLDTGSVVRGVTAKGRPYAILPLAIGAGALPGGRTLSVTLGTEQPLLTGAVIVSP